MNENNFFGNNNLDPNQRMALNEAQIQRNNAQINNYLNGRSNNFMAAYNNGYFNNQYPQQPQFLKCRPVTSIEEARAAQIDLDGSLWVFTDVAHGKIYTKQIRNNGSSAFGVYTYTDETPQTNNINSNDFVTKAELKNVVDYFMQMLPKQQPQQAANNETIKNDPNSLLKF